MAPPPINHNVEVLDRLAAVRLIADEYLEGHWVPTKSGLSNIAGLATWAACHQAASGLERKLAA